MRNGPGQHHARADAGQTEFCPAPNPCNTAELRQRFPVRIVHPMSRLSRLQAALGGLAAWGATTHAMALIFFGTADPAFHTTAPTGEYSESGWQWLVDGGFCATVIGPHHIVSARHLGLTAGIQFRYKGLLYEAIRVASPGTGDLSLLEIAGRMPDAAPRYRGTNEIGSTLFMTGRGTPRGEPVYGPPPDGTRLQGWRWGNAPGDLRWGTNSVAETYLAKPTDPITGDYLVSYFTDQGGNDLTTLSIGDSGGGGFIRDDDGTWKLAGINYGVEAVFNTTTTGDGFYAALYDRTGFYEFDDDQKAWIIDPTQAEQPGTSFLLTRISSYNDWLDTELARPPETDWPRLMSSDSVDGPYLEHPAYSVLIKSKSISVSAGDARRFFRLESDHPLTVKAPSLQKGMLVFTYE